MYSPRKMIQKEFTTADSRIKRDASGALCHFAVEHSSGAKVVGLSWQQACEIAETRNMAELEAA